MGMDLSGTGLHYNWTGWISLAEELKKLGVDISEFRGHNSGDPISGKTCAAIAEALAGNREQLVKEWLPEMTPETANEFLDYQIEGWERGAANGGCLQV